MRRRHLVAGDERGYKAQRPSHARGDGLGSQLKETDGDENIQSRLHKAQRPLLRLLAVRLQLLLLPEEEKERDVSNAREGSAKYFSFLGRTNAEAAIRMSFRFSAPLTSFARLSDEEPLCLALLYSLPDFFAATATRLNSPTCSDGCQTPSIPNPS